jgi:hypothetical protein
MEVVAWLPTRTYLAVDAEAVARATLARGVGGERLVALERERLPAGALLPSPTGRNLLDADAVREAVRRVLGAGSPRVTLVLPDGLARLALVEPSRGVAVPEYVRFRLAPTLPWAESEGLFDALAAGSGRVVGAALRRATVAEYEQALAAAGVVLEGVQLAPLLALARLRGDTSRDEAHALLGDVAACLARVERGTILALSSRRRDRSAGEAARLHAELARLQARAPGSNGVPLALSGSDAAWLRSEHDALALTNGHRPGPAFADGTEAGWLLGLRP